MFPLVNGVQRGEGLPADRAGMPGGLIEAEVDVALDLIAGELLLTDWTGPEAAPNAANSRGAIKKAL